MYGDDISFRYAECADCGTLQLLDPPADMGWYYREPYISWQEVPAYVDQRLSALSRLLRGWRFADRIGRFNPVGRIARHAFGEPEFPFPLTWFEHSKAGPGARIFDFGCGSARVLKYLRYNGYRHLHGHDRYMRKQTNLPGLELTTEIPSRLAAQCDLVMAHHSLEHLDQPFEGVQELKRLLKPGATLLIRVPVAQSHAWRQYGTSWVQLDAPRHQVLPSEQGMRRMLERAGLSLTRVDYDSSAFQFVGSEQYLLDIPLFDPQRSFVAGHNPDLFSAKQRADWAQLAQRLNEQGDGDQACFYARLS